MQYYYPSIEQYPFDRTCNSIISALEKRGWVAPGVIVRFRNLRERQIIFKCVSCIEVEGVGVKIYFGRMEKDNVFGREAYPYAVAVEQINIPGKEICIDSRSGPSFFVYVGDNWEKDCNRFLKRTKLSEERYKGFYKREGSRKYLAYIDKFQKPGEKMSGCEENKEIPYAPYLVAESLDGKYAPRGDEPLYYNTEKVFHEFDAYLRENVLKVIEQS